MKGHKVQQEKMLIDSEKEKTQEAAVAPQDSIPSIPSAEHQDDVLPSGSPQPSSPTAVPWESKAATQFDCKPVPSAKYPDLSSMGHVEFKADQTEMYKPNALGGAISHLKPFTTEQLREIYYCPDIEIAQQFELEFLMKTLLENNDTDPFVVLLLKYFNLQRKLDINHSDLMDKRRLFEKSKRNVWSWPFRTAEASGLCGDEILVHHKKRYDVAVMSKTRLALAVNVLNEMNQLLCGSYTINLADTNLTKIKIDKIIDEIMSHNFVRNITNESPVSLNTNLNPEAQHYINRLRQVISILFSFLRQQSPNQIFTDNIKYWLNKLISLHIRVATREDHWLLLFHVLRCPNGIGNWAKHYIQLPLTDKTTNNEHMTISSAEINHCVAILHILLQPIVKRNDFLNAFSQSDTVKENMWILIESDGEEATTTNNGECIAMSESDLIALLDQMPFEMLFCYVLNIEKTWNNNYNLEVDSITDHQMLKVIAFFSKLVEIFGNGIFAYNTRRYKQLSKRLGRLMRHVFQYVSDYHELFIRNNLSKDPNLCERINVELNSLLLKTCVYVYRTRNLTSWQYFSSLPYYRLDASTVWQLFYYLNVGFPKFSIVHEDYIARYHETDFWNYFNEANYNASVEDLYYLLPTFFEMANGRDRVKDWELIETICLHIFEIGYINTKTHDICVKTSRDMLVHLTITYNDLIPSLFLQLKKRFVEIENATYLFQSLPLENWKPEMDSFETLSSWLLDFDYKTKQNTIARIIVSHLNWGLDCDDNCLYLPHNIHVRMACTVSEALTKHAPEVLGQSGKSKSARIFSNNLESQSTKEQFTSWCWIMVTTFRLHLMDQSVDSIRKTLRNPSEAVISLSDSKKIEVIYQGVAENQPLSMYLAIMVSPWGHSVPLICQKGFDQMKLLLNDYRHAAVIRCIELIVPLFMETPETLAKCESFQTILFQLLNEDKTLWKTLFSSSNGPVLDMLDNMIQHQIFSYDVSYGLNTPLMLIKTWLHVLTNVPNWQNTKVLYLIDKILTVAYQFPNAWMASKEYFRNYYKDCDAWKKHKTSTFKVILFSQQHSRVPNLTATNYGWFALLLLDVEFDLQDSKIWSEFVKQLSLTKNDNKINIDKVLQKTCAIAKYSTFSAQNLVIYKYANIISTIECKHPALPLLAQQFFILFLARVPVDPHQERLQCSYGVLGSFYKNNVKLVKKMKANLQAAEKFYLEKVAEDSDLAYFCTNCKILIKTYCLWLEDPTINKISKNQLNFPPQYNPEKLQETISGNTQHWTAKCFLLTPKEYQWEQWSKIVLRSKSKKQHVSNAPPPKPKTTPFQRIKTLLNSYEKRLDAPALVASQNCTLSQQKFIINEETVNDFENNLKILDISAKQFNLKRCELNLLAEQFKELAMNLYKNEPAREIKYVKCTERLDDLKCKKAAVITLNYEKPKKQVMIEGQMISNSNRLTELMGEFLFLNMDDLADSIDKMESVIRFSGSSQVESGCVRQYSKEVKAVGIQLYTLVNIFNHKLMMEFPPCKNVCYNFLTRLSVFTQDNHETEGLEVLSLVRS